MDKESYHKYLRSVDWLLKKNKLINTYLEQGWKIHCKACESTDSLQVHHVSYKNVGNEILDDERIWELAFLCRGCHEKNHFEKGFREKHFPTSKETNEYLDNMTQEERDEWFKIFLT